MSVIRLVGEYTAEVRVEKGASSKWKRIDQGKPASRVSVVISNNFMKSSSPLVNSEVRAIEGAPIYSTNIPINHSPAVEYNKGLRA